MSEIAQVVAERNAKIAEINGYQDLTEEAKARRVSEVNKWAESEVHAIQEYEQQKMEKELADSKRALFNVSVSPTYSDAERAQVWQAFRSAWNEVRSVSKITHQGDMTAAVEVLEGVLDQAERTGDEHLAHAAFLRAVDLGGQSINLGTHSVNLGGQAIVDRYLSTRPKANKAWERYTKAQEAMNHSQSLEGLLVRAQTNQMLNS
jgi:hypothetical protein